MDFQKNLKDIIRNIATVDIDSNEIMDATVLTDDLGFDSVQIISLIVEIELQFDVKIEDDDLDIEKLTVFKNLSDMLAHKIKGKQL